MRRKYQRQDMYESIHTYIHIFLLFLLISLIPVLSQAEPHWVPFPIYEKGGDYKEYEEGTPPIINIGPHNLEHTEVEIIITGMWVEDVIGPDGFTYQILEIPDYSTTNDVGMPELPTVMGILGIPDGSDVSINVLDTNEFILDNYYVWPYQPPRHPDEEWVFEKNEDFYGSDDWYTLEHTLCGEPGIFKYWTVDNVGYVPFEFNPATMQLKVNSHIIFDVIHPNGSAIQTAVMDSATAELMNATLWNFEELPYIVDDYTPRYYLIIVPDEFYNQTLLFAKWVEDTYGYITRTKKLSEVGNTYQEINQFIEDFYNSNNSTDYVLFIGDTDRIPSFPVYSPVDESRLMGYGKIIYSDFYYSEIKGNDHWPEVAIGRISYNGNIELQFQFNKIISYYLTQMPPPNPDWRENVLLIASRYDEEHKINFSSMAIRIADCHYKYQDPNFTICFGEYGDDNSDVTEEINEGVSSVWYTGHGRSYEWSVWNKNDYGFPYGPNWTIPNIEELHNFYKLPVVFNVTCLNGKIIENSGEESLCEAWMYSNYYENEFIGAVTTLGFSHLYFCVSQYKCPFSERLYQYIYDYEKAKNRGIGWLIYHGIVKTYYEGLNRSDELHNILSTIVLGDPALRIRRKSSETKEVLNNNIKLNKLYKLKNVEIKVNNPVYDSINIFINSNKEEKINIDIYDISGRKLDELYCGKLNIGENKIEINNIGLNSGLYIMNIYSENFNEVRNVVVIK